MVGGTQMVGKTRAWWGRMLSTNSRSAVVMCVCVCERERERDTQRETE